MVRFRRLVEANRVFRQEAAKHLKGRRHKTAAIVAQVEDDTGGLLVLRLLERGVKLLGGLFVEMLTCRSAIPPSSNLKTDGTSIWAE